MPHPLPPLPAEPPPHYLVGIDIGREQCSCCVLTPDKTVVFKPFEFSNAAAGFTQLADKLTRLPAPPAHIWIGLEATARYWENLYFFLQQRGYRLLLLHPGQTHHFAQQRGLRAKTDRLDATTIVRVLLSDEVRPAYAPSAEIVAYRELARLYDWTCIWTEIAQVLGSTALSLAV